MSKRKKRLLCAALAAPALLAALAEARALMPADYTETVLQGGNHAGFGLYGAQDGDGAASITAQEQQAQTAALILDFVNGSDGGQPAA